MSLFMGVDASTQSISALVADTDTGRIAGEASVSFSEFPEFNCPQGFLPHDDPLVKHADPLVWLAGLEQLFARLQDDGIDLAAIRGISGSGQQHGTVYLGNAFLAPDGWDASGGLVNMVRPLLSRTTAPLWMDSATSAECREITAAAGGSKAVQRITGSPPVERFSGPQIRKFYKDDPDAYDHTAVVHLVSSFMASILAGRNAPVDLGDGAGMNLLNLAKGDWDERMLEATAPDLRERLPAPVPSDSAVGFIADHFVRTFGFTEGTPVVAWSGDNPNSLIGVGAHAPGTAVASLGTSHTYFAAMSEPRVDPAGYGHVFGNPAGGFMSLICFKNGALAVEDIRKKHDLSWEAFSECLRQTPPGNNGNMLLPYFVPEITPLVLQAGVIRSGSRAFERGEDAAASARAVVEAQALRLRLHSDWIRDETKALRVTGGASVNTEICQILADVFNARVERLETGNSAALGAALRAAHCVTQQSWDALASVFCKPVAGMDVLPIPEHVAQYERMLDTYATFAANHRKAEH